MTEHRQNLTDKDLQDLISSALLDLMNSIEKTDRPDMADLTPFIMAKAAIVAFNTYAMRHVGTRSTVDLLRCVLSCHEQGNLAELEPRGSA